MVLEDRLRQTTASLPEVRLAVLFGSTARGKAGPRSDVDLGVLLEPDTPDVRLRVEAELGRAVGDRAVDVIFLKEAPPLLRFEIAKEGVVLHQNQDDLWTDFKTRAMLDWYDWEPIARRIEEALIERLRRKVEHGQA
ncbi:MAG TPA: nucleotidyltransferase domain-containing protein [Thermoanaerobaculia bacterium]|nr:nucleotidyltransferase domain-containing protein [Thermoanaerobaculia bacterium]